MEKESHCMYGPSFLVFERSTCRFLEFFCGNKSSRSEAKKLYPYLPLSQADIDAKAARGEDVGGLEPHGPLPLTLKSRLVEKGTYSWHVPVVVKCGEAFTKLPSMDRIVKEINAFLTVKDNGVERAAAAADRPRSSPPLQPTAAGPPRPLPAPSVTCIMGGYLSRRTCRKAPAGLSHHLSCGGNPAAGRCLCVVAMNPECLLITTPAVNFRTFTGACLQVLGYSPLRAADASPRELSEAEKFLSCLAAFGTRRPRPASPPNLLSHVSFSVFLVADDRDLLDILERCSGMPFVTADTTVRGVTAAVVSGTLAQWRDAVAAGSVRNVEPSVRAGFNKVYGLFCGAGLNVWGDYRTREAPDQTLFSWNTSHNDDIPTTSETTSLSIAATTARSCRRCRRHRIDFICTDPPYGLELHGPRVGPRCSRRPVLGELPAGLQAGCDDVGLRRHPHVSPAGLRD